MLGDMSCLESAGWGSVKMESENSLLEVYNEGLYFSTTAGKDRTKMVCVICVLQSWIFKAHNDERLCQK